MKIRTKLTLILLLASLLPVSVVALIARSTAQRALKQRIGASSVEFAKLAIHRINEHLHHHWDDVQTWALMDELVGLAEGNGGSNDQMSTFLANLRTTRHNRFSYLIGCDRTGRIVAASDAGLLGREFGDSRGFQQALAGEPNMQDVAYDEMARQYTLVMSAPIRDKADPGRVVGVFSCALDWQAVHEMVLDLNVRGQPQTLSDHVMLTDRDGLVISCFDREDMFKENLVAAGMQSAKEAQRGRRGYLVETSEHGLVALAAYTPWVSYEDLPNPGWLFVLLQDADSTFADMARLDRAILCVVIGTLACVLAGSFLIAHRFCRPVLAVASTADSIRKGQRDRRVAVSSNDEIGVLAASFNAMVDALEVATRRAEASARSSWPTCRTSCAPRCTASSALPSSASRDTPPPSGKCCSTTSKRSSRAEGRSWLC